MIFPKSKRDSKNYNIKPKPHKNTKSLTFAATVFTSVFVATDFTTKFVEIGHALSCTHKLLLENNESKKETHLLTFFLLSS